MLNGDAYGCDVVDFNADDESETNTGHCIIVVDIARFVPLKTFTAEVDRHVRDLRTSRLLPASTPFACRAIVAPPAATSGPATVFQFRRRSLRNSTNWPQSCR